MLTDDDDTDNESSLGSDDDSFREGSYKNHEYNEETGSIRFHIKRRKESERSDEEFLLPLWFIFNFLFVCPLQMPPIRKRDLLLVSLCPVHSTVCSEMLTQI